MGGGHAHTFDKSNFTLRQLHISHDAKCPS